MPNVTPVQRTKPVAPPTQHVEHFRDQQKSTIESVKVERPAFRSQKPQLESPRAAPVWDVLQGVVNLEQVGASLMQLQNDRVDRDFAKIKELNLEQMRLMQEAIEKQKDVTFWSFLQDLGSMLLATLSSIFGLSVIAAGSPVIGAMLVAGGILSLSNTICKHLGAWDWAAKQIAGENKELEHQIKTYLSAGVGLTACALGMAGGFGAWYFGNLDAGQKILGIAQTSANLAQTTLSVGHHVSSARSNWVQSDLSLLKTNAEMTRLALTKCMKEMEHFADAQAGYSKLAALIVRRTKQTMQMTQQVV